MGIVKLDAGRNEAVFEYHIKLDEFTGLVEAHIKNVKPTANTKSTWACEVMAAEVLEKKFEWEYLEPFIRDVCRWGGFALIGGKIIRRNEREDIINCFKAAQSLMDRDNPRIGGALREINRLKNLGTPSFASKHLRFLWPKFCPILDSNTTRLGYDFTPDGYEEFAEDCRMLAKALTDKKIANPLSRSQGEWLVGEVDMAIFARLRGWA